jgi:PAB-dependent poly(A)-specific ribonuclease subunit 3
MKPLLLSRSRMIVSPERDRRLTLAIVFVYDYHPDSKSLLQLHFPNDSVAFTAKRPPHPSNTPVPEKLLWSYIVQIASGLKSIHSAGLACRVLDLTTLLVTSDRRIRLNCCGIMDVIAPLGDYKLAEEQMRDLSSFGGYMLALATGTADPFGDAQRGLEVVKKRYPGNLASAIGGLVLGDQKSVSEFLVSISEQVVTYFDSALQ